MDDQGLYQMTFTWRDRWNTGETSVTFTKEPGDLDFTFESCRRRAILCGYPGHRGGFWNYLMADWRACYAKPMD